MAAGDIKFRNLDMVRFLMKESTGLDVAYAYDDLVFSEHGLYIIRYDSSDDNKLYVYFNKEMLASKQKLMLGQLLDITKLNKVKLFFKGKFEMEQKEGADEIDIKFYSNEPASVEA